MDETFSFGYWVRRRRKALDLTQVALAARVGCAESMLRKIEADERRPSEQIAARLATALELPGEERKTFLKVARGELASHRLLAPANDAHLSAKLSPLHAPLPASPSALIGRSHEVAQLQALLDHVDVRLITLTGAGGSGKTRLALEVAAKFLASTARFSDGVRFVDLAPLAEASLVAPTIAHALGLSEAPGISADEQLRAALRDRCMLLVLDNLEQVLDSALMLSELLRAAARLAMLVTSRVALHLRGEREYPVGPLALPTDELPLTTKVTDAQRLAAVVASPAVQLFVERAQSVQPDFALTSVNAESGCWRRCASTRWSGSWHVAKRMRCAIDIWSITWPWRRRLRRNCAARRSSSGQSGSQRNTITCGPH